MFIAYQLRLKLHCEIKLSWQIRPQNTLCNCLKLKYPRRDRKKGTDKHVLLGYSFLCAMTTAELDNRLDDRYLDLHTCCLGFLASVCVWSQGQRCFASYSIPEGLMVGLGLAKERWTRWHAAKQSDHCSKACGVPAFVRWTTDL